MASTVISIQEEVAAPQEKNTRINSFYDSFMKDKKLIHSIKVGIALVSVSLLYLLNPIYERFGDNAMWAVMTVVVIFEFYAGATLGKGFNRGVGTLLGGGLGCLAAIIAQQFEGVLNGIVVASSIFIFGGAATYARLIPSIKKTYDYGVMIFMLTFTLVVVSGIRVDRVLDIAFDRLLTILMGFMICIFISIVIFPIWSSDELHNSTASKFNVLACSIEGFFEACFKSEDYEKQNQPSANFSSCKSLLDSKSKEETLANFARWEPWHGKFGFSYPWKKYLQIGEALRETAIRVLSMKSFLDSSMQPSSSLRMSLKDPCEEIVSSLAWTLRELGQSIESMRRCQREALIMPKLKCVRQGLSALKSSSKLRNQEVGEEIAVASLIYLLTDVMEKVGELAKEVEELAEVAVF